MLKEYPTKVLVTMFFEAYFWLCIFVAILILFSSFEASVGLLGSFTGFLFVLGTAFFSRNKSFRANGLSVLVCFFSACYIVIPIAFMLAMGASYDFGRVFEAPYSDEFYWKFFPIALFWLFIFWLAMWFGIVSLKREVRAGLPYCQISNLSFRAFYILGVVVVFFTIIDNSDFKQAISGDAVRQSSIFTLVFFDHAYLLLTSVIVNIKLNNSDSNKVRKNCLRFMSASFLVFSFVFFVSGSKAALLTTTLFYFLFPLAFATDHYCSKIIFFKPFFLSIVVALMPIAFYFSALSRANLGSGLSIVILEGVNALSWDVASQLFIDIGYRLSTGGLHQYLLIVGSYFADGYQAIGEDGLAIYLFKNSLNLLLPGTPFPEAYAPSSQLLGNLLANRPLNNHDLDILGLIKSLNTQPYTLFGLLVIFFGWLSPIFMMLIPKIFYSIVNGPYFILSLAGYYFFFGMLSAFGIEVVLGNTFHLAVSMLIMCFFQKKCSCYLG